MKKIIFATMMLIFFQIQQTDAVEKKDKKIGLLLVNHGSHSKTWREALLSLEKSVSPRIIGKTPIVKIKTAFMEYNEPSIATQLKAFDDEGFTDIVLVPIFITVSPHSFDDIPTIIGQKVDYHSKEMMRLEKIKRYKPRAKVVITDLLDAKDMIEKNILRRAKSLSQDPANEGLVLIAYGDKTYEKEWINLMNESAGIVNKELGIDAHSYGWCGHIAGYNSKNTTEAVEKVLKTKKKAIVIPVLVAFDEMFQVKIIGGGIKMVKDSQTRVLYRPDAILPDQNVEDWIVHTAIEKVKIIQRE